MSPQHYRHEGKMRALHVRGDVIMVIRRPCLLCLSCEAFSPALFCAYSFASRWVGRGTTCKVEFLGPHCHIHAESSEHPGGRPYRQTLLVSHTQLLHGLTCTKSKIRTLQLPRSPLQHPSGSISVHPSPYLDDSFSSWKNVDRLDQGSRLHV